MYRIPAKQSMQYKVIKINRCNYNWNNLLGQELTLLAEEGWRPTLISDNILILERSHEG